MIVAGNHAVVGIVCAGDAGLAQSASGSIADSGRRLVLNCALGCISCTLNQEQHVFQRAHQHVANMCGGALLPQIVSVQPKSDLKKSLMVKFTGEEGIDQGGVKKEFFQILTRRMFDPGFGA
jgi:hypothetical protein